MVAQSASRYNTSPGAVGRRFVAILAAKWREVLNRSWNSKRPLVFAHIILTKIVCVRRSREIRGRISKRMDFWYRGVHAGLVDEVES